MPIFFNSRGNPEKGVLGRSFSGEKIPSNNANPSAVGGGNESVIDDDPVAEAALGNLADPESQGVKGFVGSQKEGLDFIDNERNMTADELLNSKKFFPDD